MERSALKRTQVFLTEDERRVLEIAAARTGRSLSSLIRDAVQQVYGSERSTADDLVAMRSAFGSWSGRQGDTEAWVEQHRSGSRLRQRHE